jgi:serine/threonine-protein kinase
MQVAAGLGEAHRQGIIHRDVKPANIFLSNDGRALIGDFGIAKIEGSTQITRRDQLVGTPNYLAPEQILGEPVGPPTDVFALGALFFVITQNRPLRQQVDAASLLASANGNEPVLRLMATGLPDALKRTVARCLERDPLRRYVDGTAFADALADHATRVPALADSPAPAAFLREGTADRSSAFVNSSPSSPSSPAALPAASPPTASGDHEPLFGDFVAASDASSVEAMAQAMLGEVERRSTGMFKAMPPKAEAPLPVARTESTVMFNLRAFEADQAAPPAPQKPAVSPTSMAPGASLPVARSEPTSMFRLPEQTTPGARPTLALEPVTDEEDLPSLDPSEPVRAVPHTPPAGGLHEPTLLNDDDGHAPPPALRRAATTATIAPATTSSATTSPLTPAATTTPAPAPAWAAGAKAAPPRHVLVAATLVAGLLTGAAVAVVARPASSMAPADALVPTLADDTPAPRPALCRARNASAEEASQAAALLDEARSLKRDGAAPSKVVERLRNGIVLDPNNRQLFYELGRVVTGPEQDDADACVCALDPSSRECAAIEKARGR